MKLLCLVAGWSAIAWGSPYTFTASVQSDRCSPANYCDGTVAAHATFAISFSGLDQIYPPGSPHQLFSLQIPGTESVSGKLGYAGADIDVNGHSFGGTNGGQAFALMYSYMPISAMQPFMMTLDITASLSAETFDMRFIGGMYYPTTATATVVVNFDAMRILDRTNGDITERVGYTVVQESAIPEPATTLLLVAGGFFLFVVRRLEREARHRKVDRGVSPVRDIQIEG